MDKGSPNIGKNKGKIGNFHTNLTLLILFLLFLSLHIVPLRAQTIQMVRYFDTWQGSPQINSTDPAGIGYHAPSGNLYIADSEINEIFTDPPNVFEVSKLGDTVIREIATGNSEPTGITYYDGYFYVTNDNTKLITRYDNNFNEITSIRTTDDDPTATDPEGITSDPSSGDLYVVDGILGGRQVLIYDSNLLYAGGFSLSAVIPGIDPDGIAFEPDNGHLFITSGHSIYQFTTSGTLLYSYDISGFSPAPTAEQGLTFAPTSDPNDDPGNMALYIADAMVDNDIDPNERDGRIYEAVITIADFVGTPRIIAAGSEVSFTNLSPTDITSYSWDFGDEGTSTERDPSHTYNAAGVYTVSLTVSGPLGTDTETKTGYITVAEASVSFQDGVNGYSGARDTRLNSTNFNLNYGTYDPLSVDGGPDTDESALLFWDVTGIPLGSTVYAVKIIVNVTDNSGADYEIYDLKQPWVETEATWSIYASGQSWEVGGADGASDRGNTPFGAIIAPSTGPDTTSLNDAGIAAVQSWVDDPSSNHGFIVQDYINHTNGLKFSSRETAVAAERPKLTVLYNSPPSVLVAAKIFLEGPYNSSTGEMITDLNTKGYIPEASPYSEDSRSITPPIPADITDWVLVQLRATATGAAVGSRSAFLRKDGRIVADDGTTEQITVAVSPGNYYIVIKHRNHLAAMSAGSVPLSSGSATLYDFTTGTSQYYSGGARELEPGSGVWGMYGGNADNSDQDIFASDLAAIKIDFLLGLFGYYLSDVDMDGDVFASDYALGKINFLLGAFSTVP